MIDARRELLSKHIYYQRDPHFAVSILYFWWGDHDEDSPYHPYEGGNELRKGSLQALWDKISCVFENIFQYHIIPHHDLHAPKLPQMPEKSIYERVSVVEKGGRGECKG